MKLFIFLILLPLISHARWAKPTEYDFALSKFDTIYDIKKDGTYEVSFFKEFEILTEAGVKTFSSYQESFNPNSTKLIFQEAWVENDGGKIPVLSNSILESTPASKNAFDSQTTWLIKLSDIKVGSKFGVRYKLHVSKPIVNGHFSYSYYFGVNGVWIKEGSLTFKSEMPLEVTLEDNMKFLKLEKFKKKLDEVKISIIKPLAQKTIDERGVIPQEFKSAVFVSTSKNWDLIRRQIQSRFDLNLNGPIIPEIEAIIQQVKGRNELDQRVSLLLSLLNSKLKHVPDWQLLNGQIALRPFKDIFKSGYADDKELTALVTVILKKLGHPAEIAVLEKSSPLLNSIRSMPLPVVSHFNHAIVRVETQADTFWIDPSLAVNFGMNLPEDVLGKFALILNANSELDKISSKNTLPAIMSFNNFYFNKDGKDSSYSMLSLTGIFAYNLFQKYLQNPDKKSFDNRVALFMAGNVGLEKADLKPYKLNPNEFSNLEFSGQLTYEFLSEKDDKGQFFFLPDFAFPHQPYTTVYQDRVGSLYLGEPQEYRIELHFNQMVPVDKNDYKTCEVISKWYEFSRRGRVLNGVYTVHEKFEVKVSDIGLNEIMSEEFKSKGKQLKDCLIRSKIYFKSGPVTK